MRFFAYYILLLSFCLKPSDILACDCDDDDITVEKAVSKSKIIVVAQVVELLDTRREKRLARYHPHRYESYRVKIKVNQSLKGSLSLQQIVEIGSAYTDCNIIYDKRKEYLLFLEKKGLIYEEQGCTKSGAVKGNELLITQVKQAVKKGL
jgi:predicted transcriptional regulator